MRFFSQALGRAGSGSEVFHRKRARIPASVLGQNYADAVIRRMEIDALVQYFEQSLEFSRVELLAMLNIGETDFWTYYRDPDDFLGNVMGPLSEERNEDVLSEAVARLRLNAGAPPVQRQLRCAPEDVHRDQQLRNARHLLQREEILPERLIAVSEGRVRLKIEATHSKNRQIHNLERLYGSGYQ